MALVDQGGHKFDHKVDEIGVSTLRKKTSPPRHRIHDFFDAGARERHAVPVHYYFALFDAGDCREALYSLLIPPRPPY